MLNDLKQYKLFQRLISVPYALIFVAFLLPLVSVSCMDKVVAQPNAYSLSTGVDLKKALDPQTIQALDEIKQNGDESMQIPMQTEALPVLFVLFVGVLAAVVFAFVTPVGTLAMGVADLLVLWVFLNRLPYMFQAQDLPFTVKPAAGAYCVSMLLIIGIAMSLAAIIRYHKLKAAEAKAFAADK